MDALIFEYTNITVQREPQAIRKLAEIAGRIAYHNFEWRYVTLLMFGTVQAIGVETFMKQYGKSVIMKLGEFAPRHRVTVPQYVLFFERTSEIQHYIEWIIQNKYQNTGKFIIVCASIEPTDCNEQAIFRTCMNEIIVNVVFLRVGDDRSNPVGFTYWPVGMERCFDSSPVKLDLQWNNTKEISVLNMFPDKLHNMHQCNIKVSAYEQHPFMYLKNPSHPEGLDGRLLMVIMKALNASFEIVQPEDSSWGHFLNDTWTGAVGEVFKRRAHISMCSAPLTFLKYGSFQISSMYNSMDMIWVSSLPLDKPAWEKLLHPLKIYIRICLLLMFILIAVSNSALKTKLWSKVRKALNIAPPRSNLLFRSWMIFLGLPLSKFPRNLTLLLIVYQWVWFCFIIRSIYQATLIFSIKHPAYQQSFQTLEEVLRARVPFGDSVTLKEFFSEDREVYDSWIEVPFNETYDLVDDIAAGRSQFHLAWSKEMMISYLMYYNGTKQLHIVPEKIVNSPTVIYMRKFSPLARPIDRVLSHLREGGFTDRSYARYIYHGSYQQRRSTPAEPLRLSHFSGPAVTLVFGWISALFFFILEIWCDRYEKKILSKVKDVERDTYPKL